ncbi:spore coat CotO family protein [Cytobacillus firmus]|uniref:hypothetical protein n=1 Tax=Cytobacillus firmus TaxID=1399 RepID=UPI00218B3085|nr:hypothetical protein [Cytobacillus firmus]URM32015.1 spore coat CotO family protein [Cytobacillus firmus]
MTEKREKEPLFYIQQPNFQIPENRMQTIYSSRKAEQERKQNENVLDLAVPKEVQKVPEEKIENTAGQMEVQEVIEEFESGREEKKVYHLHLRLKKENHLLIV